MTGQPANLISDIMRALIAAGATSDVMLAAVAAYDAHSAACYAVEEERQQARRDKARDKKRAQRVLSRSVLGTIGDTEGQPGTDRDSEGQSGTIGDDAGHMGTHGDNPSPKENPPESPKEITLTPKESISLRSIPKKTPRQELRGVLDETRADAVLEHRQRIGKPMTAYAARLLVGKLAQCTDPNVAADTMIARGWQAFEPEWLERGRGPPVNGHANTPMGKGDSLLIAASHILDRAEREDNGKQRLIGKPPEGNGRVGADVLGVSYSRGKP